MYNNLIIKLPLILFFITKLFATEKENWYDSYRLSQQCILNSKEKSQFENDGRIFIYASKDKLISQGCATFAYDPKSKRNFVLTAHHVVAELFNTPTSFATVYFKNQENDFESTVLQAISLRRQNIPTLSTEEEKNKLNLECQLFKKEHDFNDEYIENEAKKAFLFSTCADDIAILLLESYPNIQPASLDSSANHSVNQLSDCYLAPYASEAIKESTAKCIIYDLNINTRSLFFPKNFDDLTSQALFPFFKRLFNLPDKGIVLASTYKAEETARPQFQQTLINGMSGSSLKNKNGNITAITCGSNHHDDSKIYTKDNFHYFSLKDSIYYKTQTGQIGYFASTLPWKEDIENILQYPSSSKWKKEGKYYIFNHKKISKNYFI